MSSIKRKIKRNKTDEYIKKSDIKVSIKFVCPNCNNTKILTQEEFNKVKDNELRLNQISICDKCGNGMFIHQVLADF